MVKFLRHGDFVEYMVLMQLDLFIFILNHLNRGSGGHLRNYKLLSLHSLYLEGLSLDLLFIWGCFLG